MSNTPGTPEWLRAQAAALQQVAGSSDMAQGLIRAANRIVRLQGELSKHKTGVDQTRKPLSPSQIVAIAEGSVLVKMVLPDSDEIHEAIFDWVNESESLGIGYLDAMTLLTVWEAPGEPIHPEVFHNTAAVPPKSKTRLKALKLKKLIPARAGQPHVEVRTPNETVELEDCALAVVEEIEGVTVIELAAKSERILEWMTGPAQ